MQTATDPILDLNAAPGTPRPAVTPTNPQQTIEEAERDELRELILRSGFAVPRTWPKSDVGEPLHLVLTGVRSAPLEWWSGPLADKLAFGAFEVPRDQAERVFAAIRSERANRSAATRKAAQAAPAPTGPRTADEIHRAQGEMRERHIRERHELAARQDAEREALVSEYGRAVAEGR